MFTTREQQHFFNAPYQLAVVPPKMLKRGAIMDKPTDAEVVSMTVESGDIVLLATDGLFDNLFDKVRLGLFILFFAALAIASGLFSRYL